jgi:hypothetical protein
MTKFSLNQLVKFNRNSQVKSDSTKICGIMEMPLELLEQVKQTYIIEYENGWLPNSIRKERYDLDIAKKYLFVSETELETI